MSHPVSQCHVHVLKLGRLQPRGDPSRSDPATRLPCVLAHCQVERMVWPRSELGVGGEPHDRLRSSAGEIRRRADVHRSQHARSMPRRPSSGTQTAQMGRNTSLEPAHANESPPTETLRATVALVERRFSVRAQSLSSPAGHDYWARWFGGPAVDNGWARRSHVAPRVGKLDTVRLLRGGAVSIGS